tara:strand:+ start:2502 stop:2771 length:270 start_codon:yes stop_codon:yes gene_type:complete
MPREIKYEVYFDDEIDKALEDIQLECEKIELKLDKLGEKLEKIADCIYDADYISCRKELWSKLNSKAYDLQYKLGCSSWIKNFRIDPHR